VLLAADEVFGGLLVLFLASLPLGAVVLRGAEWAIGHRFLLSLPERVLSAFFAAGALFFLVASLPLPIYFPAVVLGLLALGVVALLGLWWKEAWRPLAAVRTQMRAWPLQALTVGTLGLLALEVVATASQLMPNTNDGSFESLYVQLILSHHTLPWTFAPYSGTGIIYPAGTAVWMSLPVLIFGWPVSSSPVVLPDLFLSLSVVGAFCWGERLGGFGSSRGMRTGLIFAGFFGLIGSWPRLFVGGSYDFAFALPLLLMAFGWLRPFVSGSVPTWRETMAFGVLVGVSTALSVGVGEMLVILFLAYLVVFSPRARTEAGKWVARSVTIVAVGVAFVVRSLVGIVVWYPYPGHVLNPAGTPPYAPTPVGPSPLATSWSGDLDPFVPFKPRLSPIPVLSVELAVLLALGLAVLALWVVLPRGGLRRYLPSELAAPIIVSTAVTFSVTAVLVAITVGPLGRSVLAESTTAYESSFLLFICFQAVALLPLAVAVEYLRVRSSERDQGTQPAEEHSSRGGRRQRITARAPTGSGAVYAIALVLVVGSFGLGAGATLANAPGYIQDHLHELSNVTSADVNALEWAGANLPSCSRVLAAPSSAAMFLNLYAHVQLVFPAFPLPVNLSYYVAVANLTHGTYTNATRNALQQLQITEVFVTGQTSVSYLPFQSAEMRSSGDFASLFDAGDASVFQFLPGTDASGCVPR
jgi:hypothetical protein